MPNWLGGCVSSMDGSGRRISPVCAPQRPIRAFNRTISQTKRTYTDCFISLSLLEQGCQLLQNLLNDGGRCITGKHRIARSPVQATRLVGQYNTENRKPRRDRNLKRITFDLTGYGTKQCQTDLT